MLETIRDMPSHDARPPLQSTVKNPDQAPRCQTMTINRIISVRMSACVQLHGTKGGFVTTKRRTVPLTEVRSILDMLKRDYGFVPNSVDIRQDGVTVSCIPAPDLGATASRAKGLSAREQIDAFFAAKD